jgi:hypothetical protein
MRLQWGIMKSNRICIMAWAQEIDRSISSASYHGAVHRRRLRQLSFEQMGTNFPKSSYNKLLYKSFPAQ